MTETLSIYSAVIPVFLVIAVGFVLRRFRFLSEEIDRGLLTLVVHVLIPCLIIDKMAGNPLVGKLSVLGIAAGVGFVAVAGAILISYAAGRRVGMKKGAGLRSFALGTGVQNYGFLAIPVVVALFPDSPALGVLFVHSLGVEVAIWTVGIMVLTGSRRFAPRTMFSGPVVAVLLGLLFSWTGFDQQMNGPASEAIGMLGQCAVPMALLLVGMTVADMMRHTEWSVQVLATGAALRLMVLPLLYMAAAYFVAGSYPAIAVVFIVQAAMPSGNFPIVLARHYGGKPEVPIQLVVATTLGSVISMPLWLALGKSFL